MVAPADAFEGFLVRYNLHPLRNLPVGTDPGVLTSDGMSVTGGAVVSLGTVENLMPNPSFAVDSAAYRNIGPGVPERVESDLGVGGFAGRSAGISSASGIVCSTAYQLGDPNHIPVVPGRSCSARWKIDARQMSTQWRVQAFWRNGNNGNAPISTSALPTISEHDIREIVFPMGVAPANATHVSLEILTYVSGVASGSQPCDLTFTDLLIEQSIAPRPFYAGTLPVPAYNPHTGALDDTYQAVRVYWPASAGADDGHTFTLDLTALDTPPSLIAVLHHVRADDPGSVGRKVYAHIEYLDGDDQSLGEDSAEATLTATPQALAVDEAVPVGAATAVVTLKREADTETNLLYSASQVAPHSIDKYGDEHTRGWRLRNEANRAQGAESLPTPNFQKRVLEIAAPTRKLEIAAPTRTLEVALGGPHA